MPSLTGLPFIRLGYALHRARTKYAVSLKELSLQLPADQRRHLKRAESGHVAPPDVILQLYAREFRMDMRELNRLTGRDAKQKNTAPARERVEEELRQLKGKGKP